MPRSSLILPILFLAFFFLCGNVVGAQQITISDVVINTEGTGTATLILDTAPHGLSGFKIYLNITDPSVAEITAVTYPSGFSMSSTSPVPFTSGTLKAMDLYATFVPDGSTGIPLATVTLHGLSPGLTRLHGTVAIISANIPWSEDYTSTTTITDGKITVNGQQIASSNPVAIPDYINRPTDPNTDGLYEDLNGDGLITFDDVRAYFEYYDWIQENEPASLFDFNANGKIDFGDIIRLNQER